MFSSLRQRVRVRNGCLDVSMSETDYGPSPRSRVAEQVAAYEASDGREAATMQGLPIVVVTMRGARSGKVRKVPLMRVEHEGRYVLVASQGGSPRHPQWYFNVRAHPEVVLQDGARRTPMAARELDGAEREEWWARAVEAFPPYAGYQERTDRRIPVLLLEPTA